jgi:hypothetical protein
VAASGEPVHFDFVVGDAMGGAAAVARGTDGCGLFFHVMADANELGSACGGIVPFLGVVRAARVRRNRFVGGGRRFKLAGWARRRSFVAKGAPQDDGQVPVCVGR